VGTSTFRLSKGLEFHLKQKKDEKGQPLLANIFVLDTTICWQFHFPSHSTIPLNTIGPKRNPILAPKLSSSPMQVA